MSDNYSLSYIRCNSLATNIWLSQNLAIFIHLKAEIESLRKHALDGRVPMIAEKHDNANGVPEA
jgi:hypothetical protein